MLSNLNRESRPMRAGISSVLVVSSGPVLGSGSIVSSFNPHKSTSLATEVNLHDARVQSWQATAALIIAEVVGTGVLALGGSFSKVGWYAGFFVLIAGYFINVFTSLLLGYVHVAYPDCVTLGDALTKILGKVPGYFGYVFLYAYLATAMINYIIVLRDSVIGVFWSLIPGLCKPVAAAIGCALLLPGCQLRSLAGITLLCIGSFIMILAVIGASVYSLSTFVEPVPPVLGAFTPCTGVPDAGGFLDMNAALGAFIFAYSGQAIMLEMQAEMTEPEDFPKAAIGSFSGLLAIYAVIATAAFYCCGAHTPGNIIPSTLPKNIERTIVSSMMVMHLIVSYTILQQVLTRALCLFCLPSALESGAGGHVKWFAVSSTVMGFGYVVANSVPLFSDIVGITGSLFSTTLGLTFPPMLYLGMYYQKNDVLEFKLTPCARKSIAIFCVIVLIIAAYLTIVGTASSVAIMLQHFADGEGGLPFSC